MNIPSVNTKVEFIRYESPLYMTAPQSNDKTFTGFPLTSPVPMPLDASGLCRIKSIKDNVYVGRSPIEDKSLLPKSLVPLTPEELGRNAVFEYNLGFNHTLWEFHSLGSGVAKAEVLPNGKPALRPAAILEEYIVRFNWEIQENPDRTLIKDLETGKVWTLPEKPDELGDYYVILEDHRPGDDSQLWKIEQYNEA